MSRLVLRFAVLIALLWGGTALSAKGRLAEFLATDGRIAKLGTTLQQHAFALGMIGGLLLGAYQLPAQAQGEAEPPPQVWTAEMSQETYNSVYYMTPNKEGSTTLRHVLYVGDTDEGEHLFAGFYMYFLDAWQGNLRFYDSDGNLLADGVERTDVKVFPDPFDDFTVVNLFTIAGLELDGTQTPIKAIPYPLDEHGKELHLVAYGANADAPDSLFNLVRRQRTCEVTDPKGWGNVGVGMSNCAPPDGIIHSINGAPILDPETGELLAFYGEPARVGYVALQNAAFVQFFSEQETVTAVSSKGKLPTKWAAIKAGH